MESLQPKRNAGEFENDEEGKERIKYKIAEEEKMKKQQKMHQMWKIAKETKKRKKKKKEKRNRRRAEEE